MVISILDRKLDVFSGVSKMKLHHLFFVLVLHILQGCCAQQMFREEPQYTEVNPGSNAELRCVIENIGGECRWQKDGKPIGLYNGKYEWAARAGSGDCSLNLMAIDIKFDDGLWECQVTASSFESQDALASKPARLVVREPPKSFAIIQNNEAKESSTDITVVDGKLETLHCESRKSNPPPVLQWFLGDKQLRASVQKNVTEDDDTRRWKAYSVLEHVFSQDDFGKSLICRVVHPAYTNDHEETAVKLDLLYKPKVTVTRVADDVLEEGRSAVKMTCTSDANPPGRVFWRKYGVSEERQFVETLEFNPVMRKDSGTYVCQAENAIGLSAEETVELDVLFPPKILRVTPGGGATIGVHNQSILTCSAEGNPLPKYVWLQKLPSNQVLKRGYEDKLIIDDTTYDHQGEYVCEAVNVIGDQKKIVQSEPVRMEVRGAPQVLRYSVAKEVEAVSGRDVRLEMEVCSDPIPSKTTWDWGSLRVEAGQDLHGRYLAEQMVQHPEREDCYIARLVVKKVSPTDSRRYYLRVENAHGEDRYAVELNVKEPVSMASVIGVVIGLLVLFVILVIVLLYAYKKQKLCFKDESKLDKSVDGMNASQGFDAEKAGGHSNGLPSAVNGKNGGLNGNGNGVVGPLPPDGMYHVSDINGGNTNIDMIHGSLTDKLWPENPTYQVYVPGYHNAVPGQPGQQHLNGGGGVAVYGAAAAAHAAGVAANGHRARSVSPHEVNATSLSDHPRANSRGGILYAELQFPVTSNYGSMKKRSQRERVQDQGHPGHPGSMSGNTTATTSVNSGEPSPTHMGPEAMGSMDSVHRYEESQTRYVPEYVPVVSARKTAV